MTVTEAALILVYVVFALVRQVRHDVCNIVRWLAG